MTDKEKAIAWCEDLIVQSNEIMPQCTDALKAELVEQIGFAETAMTSLRERIERDKGWISVKDRLPEKGDCKVLVYIPVSECIQHGFFLANLAPVKADDGRGNFWGAPTPGSNWTVWGFSYFEEPRVTHWMPLPALPAPPKEETDD